MVFGSPRAGAGLSRLEVSAALLVARANQRVGFVVWDGGFWRLNDFRHPAP